MKPQLSIQGLTFFPIPEVSGVEAAFGATEKSYFDRHNLPEVPEKYENMAHKLFYSGGNLPDGVQSDVDRNKAIDFLTSRLVSFAPAHESKMATVAYALWVWCEADLSVVAEEA